MPRKQKVSFYTGNKEAEVYVDKEFVGEGTNVEVKLKKRGMRQVVVRVPEHKDAYYVLVPQRRHGLFYPMAVLDVASFYGIYALYFPNNASMQYDRSVVYKNETPYPSKKEDEKEIDIIATGIDIKDINKGIVEYNIEYSKDLYKQFELAEKNKLEKDAKLEAKLKKKKSKLLIEEEDAFQYDDTHFSDGIFETLWETGYVDTLGKMFSSNGSLLGLEASIKKISIFKVYPHKKYGGMFVKVRMDIDWLLKNYYDEVIDSISTSEFSGDYLATNYAYTSYSYIELDEEDLIKSYNDCVNNSFLSLFSNPTFVKRLKISVEEQQNDPLLTLAKPQQIVDGVKTAIKSSVIIKHNNMKGHGSGFAITQDGYIITNFHVISSEVQNVYEEFMVVLPNGEEVEAEVVRVNKLHDLALLKVDASFENAFYADDVKAFESYDDVYTIGTPKSLDLGQTVSKGLLSNERKGDAGPILQLSMSVNSGNSGGPLFGENGALHGVVTSKLYGVGTEGISFAVPTYKLQEYLSIEFK